MANNQDTDQDSHLAPELKKSLSNSSAEFRYGCSLRFEDWARQLLQSVPDFFEIHARAPINPSRNSLRNKKKAYEFSAKQLEKHAEVLSHHERLDLALFYKACADQIRLSISGKVDLLRVRWFKGRQLSPGMFDMN